MYVCKYVFLLVPGKTIHMHALLFIINIIFHYYHYRRCSFWRITTIMLKRKLSQTQSRQRKTISCIILLGFSVTQQNSNGLIQIFLSHQLTSQNTLVKVKSFLTVHTRSPGKLTQNESSTVNM